MAKSSACPNVGPDPRRAVTLGDPLGDPDLTLGDPRRSDLGDPTLGDPVADGAEAKEAFTAFFQKRKSDFRRFA